VSADERRGGRPANLAEAMASFLAASGLAERLGQASIIAEWPALVGEKIAAVTEPEAVTADGLLRVKVASPAWASELGLMTPVIIARLNAGRPARIRGIRWIPAGEWERPTR
jgi:predicted nucleic acid-binding Zn ribbon protein